MGWLQWATLFLCGVGIVSVAGDATYVVIIPTIIRPSLRFDVSIQLTEATTSEVTVTGKLVSTSDSDDVLVSGSLNIGPSAGSQKVLSLDVPDELSNSEYVFLVKGTGGLTFENETTVQVSYKVLMPFIQTDKAIYQPGQTVKYRVMAVYSDLKPYLGKFKITIVDKNDNKMDQKLDVEGTNVGVYTGEFPLSDEPVLGDWKIMIETETNEQKEKIFTVEEYVLPKIEVSLEGPSFWHKSFPELTVTVTAKYTFGQPVKGHVYVEVYLSRYITYTWSDNPYNVYSTNIDLVDGKATVTLTKANLRSLYDCTSESYCGGNKRFDTYHYTDVDLVFNATAFEAITGDEYKGNTKVPLKASLYTLAFTDSTPDTYKIMMPWVGILQVKRADGSPPLDTDLKDENGTARSISVDFRYYDCDSDRPTDDSVFNKPSEIYEVPSSGVVVVELRVKGCNQVSISAEFPHDEHYTRQVNAYKTIDKFLSLALQGLQVKIRGQVGPLQPSGSAPVVFEVKTTIAISHYFYQILSKGNIVESGSESASGKTNTFEVMFNKRLAQKASPNARIVVWYITSSGEIILDSIEVQVDGTFTNDVSMQFSADTVSPGDDVSVTVSAAPQSSVFLLAVDQSVLLLKGGNDVTQNDVMEGLQQYDTSPIHGGGIYPRFGFDKKKKRKKRSFWGWWPIFSGGKDTWEVIENAGIIVLTDAYIHKEEDDWYSYYYSYYAWSSTYLSAFSSTTSNSDEANEISDGESPDQMQQEIRDFFPETWIWESRTVSANGQVTIEATAPDTITSWVLSTFAMSTRAGMGIADNKLTVFKAFFVQVNLPYSAIRSEILELKVVVFNYLSEKQLVKVTLAKNDDFYAAGPNELKPTQSQKVEQDVQVPASDGVEVIFRITPMALGQIPVLVRARSNQASDAVKVQLLVEAEGEPYEYSKSLYITLEEGESFSEKLMINYTEDVVQDSERVVVTAIADIMGPTISNMDQLLQMPYGCGEQNMLNFAPNIYIMNYMVVTDTVTSEIREKAINYMEIGKQKEMTYQRIDGSFSAFGDSDDAGSMWLTAFVLRCFEQAKPYVTIDQNVINKGARFIVDNAANDGSLPEPENGRVLHAAMQGAATKGIPLTAYVAKVLHEIKDSLDGVLKTDVRNTMNKARTYLESKLDSIKEDPYALSLTCYFLVASGSSDANKCVRYFNSLATNEGGLRKWERQESEEECSYCWHPPYPRPPRNSVEMSAYGLLIYLAKNQMANAALVARYLSSMRSSLGGYDSTQDTVVAIQALSEFAGLIFGGDLRLDVSLEYGNNKQHSFDTLTRTNAGILQQKEIPRAGSLSEMTVKAEGKGTALVQMTVSFNRANAAGPQGYKLEVTSNRTDDKNVYINACAKYQASGDSGMSIIEMHMLTDHKPIIGGLKAKYKELGLKKVEADQKRVALYFDEMSRKERCVSVQTVMQSPVDNLQAGRVNVYSYYEPESRSSALYLPSSSEGVRPTPSEKCLDCMCAAQSGDSGTSNRCGLDKWFYGDGTCGGSGCVTDRKHCRCGPYLITEAQFDDCSSTVDLPYDDYRTCAWSNDCARMCITEFVGKYAEECTGKDVDKISCTDMATLLYGGKDGCKKKNKTIKFRRQVNRCMNN